MTDQETIFVRIIELPAAKMVRSGGADLDPSPPAKTTGLTSIERTG